MHASLVLQSWQEEGSGGEWWGAGSAARGCRSRFQGYEVTWYHFFVLPVVSPGTFFILEARSWCPENFSVLSHVHAEGVFQSCFPAAASH